MHKIGNFTENTNALSVKSSLKTNLRIKKYPLEELFLSNKITKSCVCC